MRFHWPRERSSFSFTNSTTDDSMTNSLSPNQGLVKPTTRPRLRLPLPPMAKGKPRRKKIASGLRRIIAANANALAKRVFRDAENVPVSIVEASKSAKVNALIKSTVQRIMAGSTSATLEQLEALAHAFDVAPYQLLIPDLDAENPQIAKGATVEEHELYRRLVKSAVDEALSRTDPGHKRR